MIDNLTDYVSKVRLFQRNARLYLLSIIFTGLGFGIYRLLFNFYILSQGYAEDFLGTLITVNSLVALLGALPAGFVSDALGRKPTLLLGSGLSVTSILGVVVWRSPLGFVSMNVLSGLGQSLIGVTGAPFMVENSGEEERSYLFSFSFGLQTTAGFMGNWLGGRLPTWAGSMLDVSATSTTAYAWALFLVSLINGLALIPLLALRRQEHEGQARPLMAPFQYAREHPRMLGKLIGPMLVTALGAGLLMPFVNVFYRQVYRQSDATIGTLFAIGSLAMGLGLLSAPPIADRFGKMQFVVLSQALSIPFLFTMGFAPWFQLSAFAYLVRLALMNMSNPIYQAFVMEHVEPEARATVASMTSMSWNFGWAFSPQVSGWLQVQYGFWPLFVGTGTSYTIAILMYYWFFLRRRTR
jgi:MFS family permease